MSSDDPMALANVHNTEVYNRVISRLHGVQRLMGEFRYWVYKLSDIPDPHVSLANKDFTPRQGWTHEQCLHIMQTVAYPANMGAMQAAVDAAKAKELANATAQKKK
jgi:hypothetical protein